MNSKKIIHFYYRFQMGGSENLTLAIIKNNPDYQHFILVMQGESPFQNFCESKYKLNFLNLNLISNKFFSYSKWRLIYNEVKKINPDVIHAYMFDSSQYGRIIAFLLKKPILIYIVNTYKNKKIRRGVINFLLSFITRKIIVCSEDVKNDVLKFDRVNAKKLITIDSFAMFDFKKDYSINLSEKFNLSAETFKLLTIARIVEQKGLFLLVDAIDICVNAFKIDKIKLFIVGDGPLKKDLVDYIASRNLSGYIFLVGEQNNLNIYLTQCNAFIDPSLWAGMNVSSIKALEASLPLLITDVGGARKLTCEGKYGVLCKANDAHSLAFGIESLLVKKKVNTKEAYEYIWENFSDTTAGRKIGELYKSLLMKI